jgi:hypothetical protein
MIVYFMKGNYFPNYKILYNFNMNVVLEAFA